MMGLGSGWGASLGSGLNSGRPTNRGSSPLPVGCWTPKDTTPSLVPTQDIPVYTKLFSALVTSQRLTGIGENSLELADG